MVPREGAGLRDWLWAPPHNPDGPPHQHDDNANQQQQPMQEVSEDQVLLLK